MNVFTHTTPEISVKIAAQVRYQTRKTQRKEVMKMLTAKYNFLSPTPKGQRYIKLQMANKLIHAREKS